MLNVRAKNAWIFIAVPSSCVLKQAARCIDDLPCAAITAAVHVGLLLLEDLPLHLHALGFLQQGLHLLLLRQFPVVRASSMLFCAAVGNLALHHYCAFRYFGQMYYNISEVIAYFILGLWIVPFALFVSLSANDYVLPTTGERQHLLDDGNVVSDYLSRKAKKYSLLSFFTYAKESILPQRSKKAF
ncbi:jg14210 [Pararge aegeria aegeria]|uniref:Protein TEX261 n=1 Tax=Pararge aegeria aegeria TaxID=348720 RepID=A0A8S4RB11_9NEOP|nr:jg14210 [Pararge aegeria aegeria]